MDKLKMEQVLKTMLEIAPRSDIHHLAALNKDIHENPVLALAELERLERLGVTRRCCKSYSNPRNYLWELVQT